MRTSAETSRGSNRRRPQPMTGFGRRFSLRQSRRRGHQINSAHGVVRAGPRNTRSRRRFHNMTMVPTHCEPPLTTNMHTQPQVPADLLKLIYRLASLDRGHVYHLTLVVPEAATAERFWTVQPAGKVENLR